MTANDILSSSFVVTGGGTRLAQFRKCLDAVGLDGCLPRGGWAPKTGFRDGVDEFAEGSRSAFAESSMLPGAEE